MVANPGKGLYNRGKAGREILERGKLDASNIKGGGTMRYLQYKTSKRVLFRVNKAYYQGLPTEKKEHFGKINSGKFWAPLSSISF